MINLPAAPAVPAPHAAAPGADLLPAPAAQGAAGDAGLAGALLDGAAAVAPAPFAALLDAMAGLLAPAGEDSVDSQAGGDAAASAAATSAAAAQAVATMLPALDHRALAALLPGAAGGTPGATPDSVAAVAAALTAPVAAAGADQAALLRQQLQANALAAPAAATVAAQALAAESARAVTAQADAARASTQATAQADALAAHEAALLDPRAALLAAAARPAAAPVPAAPAPAPSSRQSGAMDALSAALGALQAQAADGSAAPITAKDGASLLADSQRQHSEAGTLPGFRSVLANTVGQAAQADVLRLSGSPEQWQQPLRAALGDRLQLQLARNDQQAVIRLEPPNMGSVEISVRQSGGALHVNIAASHSEVLRQLNTIGDAVRQDLSQRQLGEVAVTVSSSGARNFAEGGGQQRQQQSEQQRQPGRGLDEADAGTTTFAMLSERE